MGPAGREGKNKELPLYGAGNQLESKHLNFYHLLEQNGVNMVLWRMEVEPHDRDDQVHGFLLPPEVSYDGTVVHVLCLTCLAYRMMDLYYLSYMQGTEVVSAKLFISYMGTNTAKDFKVRKS